MKTSAWLWRDKYFLEKLNGNLLCEKYSLNSMNSHL